MTSKPVGEVVVINPKTEIHFDMAVSGQPTTSNIEIKNTSREMNIAYKVKTTAPKNYVVRPNQGIIQSGQQNSVEITYIPTDANKVEDNKFLIQVAYSDLQATQMYALGNFWEKVDKKQVQSYKLRVLTDQKVGDEKQSAPQPSNTNPAKRESISQSQQQQQQQLNAPQQYYPDVTKSQTPTKSVQFSENIMQKSPEPQQQTNEASLNKSKDLYEGAPNDSINMSIAEDRPSFNSNRQENLRKIQTKLSEVKQKLQQAESEHRDIKNQCSRIQTQTMSGGKSGGVASASDWRAPEKPNGKYSLVHLIVFAIIALFLGQYLGALSTPANTVQEVVKEAAQGEIIANNHQQKDSL